MPEVVTGPTGSTPTTGFNSVTGASGAAKSTKPGGDLDKDAFLKLLVAQLKYQNPMSPADPNEFLGQTAQFTMVEKLEEISKAQSDLTVWQKVTAGQTLVGREVTGKSDLGTDVTGVVTGLTLGADGPRLLLADGSKLRVNDVTAVNAAPASPTTNATPTTGTAPSGTAPSGTAPAEPSGSTGTSPAPSAAPAGATPTGDQAAAPADATQPAAPSPTAPITPAPTTPGAGETEPSEDSSTDTQGV